MLIHVGVVVPAFLTALAVSGNRPLEFSAIAGKVHRLINIRMNGCTDAGWHTLAAVY